MKAVRDRETRPVGKRVVTALVVLVLVAGVAYLYANPGVFTSGPPTLFTFTNVSAVSLTTFSTTVETFPNAVQVTVPYGGGENEDGATQYLPQVITVVIGVNNTVTWTNQDLVAHNVISTTGAFYSSDLASGQSYTFTFALAGTYQYYCGDYPLMHGTVLVKSP